MAITLQEFESEQVKNLSQNKTFPEFSSGDTIKVGVKIIEGTTERVQYFEGVCIGKKNRGLQSTFTLRKVSHGEGVERVFPVHSPRLASVELVRRGHVRRAKIYYMRERTGKSARIKEKLTVENNTTENSSEK